MREKEKTKMVKEWPYNVVMEQKWMKGAKKNEEERREEDMGINVLEQKKKKGVRTPVGKKSPFWKCKVFGKGVNCNEYEQLSADESAVSRCDERASTHSFSCASNFPPGTFLSVSPAKIASSPSRRSLSLSSSVSALVYSASEEEDGVSLVFACSFFYFYFFF
jgi:hypothetical protein